MNFTTELDCVKCGNCVELMQNLPPECIDLVVTSPPYDNLRNYKGYSFDFENVAKELYRVMKKGGVVVWVVNDATINGSETGTSFRQALYFKDIGFNLHDTMIYKKQIQPHKNQTDTNHVLSICLYFQKESLKLSILL